MLLQREKLRRWLSVDEAEAVALASFSLALFRGTSCVWLRERADFPGFNAVYGEYFPEMPPTRSAVVSDLLVDVRVEVEVVAYKPEIG